MNGKTVVYSEAFVPFSREEVIDKVSAQMSEKRLKHVMRVEQTALSLAENQGLNLEKTSITALLHDYAKERPDDESQDVIISENLDLDLLKFGNNIWHGPVGAVLVQKELRVEDEEILSAIQKHTIGAPQMTPLEKVIFVADYIEPQRTFPGVEEARRLAYINIDESLKFAIQHTLVHLLAEKQLIYPKAVEVYNAWIPQK